MQQLGSFRNIYGDQKLEDGEEDFSNESLLGRLWSGRGSWFPFSGSWFRWGKVWVGSADGIFRGKRRQIIHHPTQNIPRLLFWKKKKYMTTSYIFPIWPINSFLFPSLETIESDFIDAFFTTLPVSDRASLDSVSNRIFFEELTK